MPLCRQASPQPICRTACGYPEYSRPAEDVIITNDNACHQMDPGSRGSRFRLFMDLNTGTSPVFCSEACRPAPRALAGRPLSRRWTLLSIKSGRTDRSLAITAILRRAAPDKPSPRASLAWLEGITDKTNFQGVHPRRVPDAVTATGDPRSNASLRWLIPRWPNWEEPD